MAEVERVLAYPKIRKHITKDEANEVLDLLLRFASQTTDPTKPPSSRSSDPGDDYLIALAEAESSALVSGDSHLLKLRRSVPIYSPRDFMKLIEAEG
jgi:predicted nucleic acid-binding protein